VYAALPDYNFKMSVPPGDGMQIYDFTGMMLRYTGKSKLFWLKPDYSVEKSDIAWSQVYWMSTNSLDGEQLQYLPSNGVFPTFQAGNTYYFHLGLYGFDKDTFNTFKAALANGTSKPTITMEDGTVYNMTKYKTDASTLYIYMVFGPFKVEGVEYSVKFYAKDWCWTQQEVPYGATATPADAPTTRESKYIGGAGWYKKEQWDRDNSERYAYNFDTPIETDLDLYWRWETQLRFRSLKRDDVDTCRALFEGWKVGQHGEKYDTLNNISNSFNTAADKPVFATAYPTKGNKFVGWYFGPSLANSGEEAYQPDMDKATLITSEPRLYLNDPTEYYYSGTVSDMHYQCYLWAITEPMDSAVEISNVDFGIVYDEPYDEENTDDDYLMKTVTIVNTGDYSVDIPISGWNVIDANGSSSNDFDFPGDPSVFTLESGESATIDIGFTRYFWNDEGDQDHIAAGSYNGSIKFTGIDSRDKEVEAYARVTVTIKHQPLNWVDWEAASCETDGHEMYYRCPGCGKYFLDSEATQEVTWEELVRPALGHDYSGTPEPIPGNAEYHNVHCINDSNHVEAMPHHFDAGNITIEPTLNSEGEYTYTCNDCGYRKTETINALYSITHVDLLSAMTDLDPFTPVTFSAEIDPTKIYDNHFVTDEMEIEEESWTNKEVSADVISKSAPGTAKVGATYGHAIVLRSISSGFFNEAALPELTYAGEVVNWNDLDYSISSDNRCITIYGLVPDVTIQPYSLETNADSVVVSTISNETYSGKPFTPTPTVTLKVGGDSRTLTKNTDYTLSYKNNTNAGTATVTISGKGNYTGTIKETFKIKPVKVTVPSGKALTYNEKTQTGVAAGANYAVSGNKAAKAGSYEATVSLKDKSNYIWTDGTSADKKIKWKIKAKAITPSVTLSVSDYTYDGKAKKPTVTVKYGSTKLASSNYTVAFKNNKNVGKASVVVTLKGNYSGSKTVTFKINPKGTSIKTPSKESKAITVKWTKQAAKMSSSRITGYQIQLATDSKFTKNQKTVSVTGYDKVSQKVTKLKGKTKYYVRVRTYKTVSGKKYYSPWSKVKTVTTKK